MSAAVSESDNKAAVCHEHSTHSTQLKNRWIFKDGRETEHLYVISETATLSRHGIRSIWLQKSGRATALYHVDITFTSASFRLSEIRYTVHSHKIGPYIKWETMYCKQSVIFFYYSMFCCSDCSCSCIEFTSSGLLELKILLLFKFQ